MALPLHHAPFAMRVLREGGEYLGREERRLWWYVGGGTAAAFALSMAVAFGYPHAIVGIPVAFWLAHRRSSRLASVRRGRMGERQVTSLLRQLPDDHYLVNDVLVEGAIGNIDHVVIGPCGVVVIETKRIAGRIRCYRDHWYVNGFERDSISRRIKRNAAALRDFLHDRHPDISPGFVEAIVVFTHPLCRVKVVGARVAVARYSELRQLMVDLGRRQRLSPAVAGRLAETLARGSGRPASPGAVRRETQQAGSAAARS
ncbi:MAG TPA: nuclease-related domain-containing protein [Candidatus Tectomicrobia bacterium]|nr:nuclease-related domain-containing protein [Candidatus Tectomicrobia bacterium]